MIDNKADDVYKGVISRWRTVMATIAEKPYRVSVVRSTGAYGMHGWRSTETCYATEVEAREYAATVKNAKKVYIQIAVNIDNWQSKGYWKNI